MRRNVSAILFLCIFTLLLSGCTGTQKPQNTQIEPPTPLEYRSVEGGFYTVFPGTPEYYTEKVDTMFGLLDTHMYTYNTDDISFLVSYMDYPEEYMSEENAEEYYDSAKQAVMEEMEGGKLVEEKEITLKQYKGRAFTITSDKMVFTEKIFVVKNRMYQQVVVTKDPEKHKTDMENFFSRFNLIQPK